MDRASEDFVLSSVMGGIDTQTANKPYNVCLICPHLGKSCDGPNFLAMSHKRWLEWCSIRKKQRYLTNALIAEAANLPKSTVDGVLAGRSEDVRFSTMQAITKVLIGGCWGEYPCHHAFDQMRESAIKSAQDLERALQEKEAEIEKLRATLAAQRADCEKKIAYLKSDIKKYETRIEKQDHLIDRLLGRGRQE